jgi:hypothetical protein
MKFFEHDALYDRCVRNGFVIKNRSEFYEKLPEIVKSMPLGTREEVAFKLAMESTSIAESLWTINSRPYYKVWPSIVDSLSKIKLDVNLSDIETPKFQSVAIRFCCEFPPRFQGRHLKSILTSFVRDGSSVYFYVHPTFARSIDGAPGHVSPVTFLGNLPGTIEDQFESWGMTNPDEEVRAMYRVACRMAIAVVLLANDPSVIKADVLAADREKFDATGDQKHVDKAAQKGVVGWRLGEEYETCPHFRRPHFALRHTGKGRTIPRIVPVKGAVVHRTKMEKVPTGYLTEAGEEVEV